MKMSPFSSKFRVEEANNNKESSKNVLEKESLKNQLQQVNISSISSSHFDFWTPGAVLEQDCCPWRIKKLSWSHRRTNHQWSSRTRGGSLHHLTGNSTQEHRTGQKPWLATSGVFLRRWWLEQHFWQNSAGSWHQRPQHHQRRPGGSGGFNINSRTAEKHQSTEQRFTSQSSETQQQPRRTSRVTDKICSQVRLRGPAGVLRGHPRLEDVAGGGLHSRGLAASPARADTIHALLSAGLAGVSSKKIRV